MVNEIIDEYLTVRFPVAVISQEGSGKQRKIYHETIHMYIDVQYTQLNSSLSSWKPSLDLTNSAHVTLDFTNVGADHSL